MLEIIPSILTSDPNEAKDLLEKCEGVVNRVSIDIIDGKFADNKTIDPSVFDDVETSCKLDFQLMVIEPINWIERCIRAGADRIIGHIEYMDSQVEFVGKVAESALGVGLGIDLSTPVDKLDSTIINDLDVILVMSTHAGFGGQEFDKSVLSKFKELNKIRSRDTTPFLIQDDGGVTLDKIDDLEDFGVDEVSVGRKLFEGNLTENIVKFQETANGSGIRQ